MRILEMGDKSKRSFVFSCGYCGAKYATQVGDILKTKASYDVKRQDNTFEMGLVYGTSALIYTNCPWCGVHNTMKITGNFFTQDEKTLYGSYYSIKTTDPEVEDE